MYISEKQVVVLKELAEELERIALIADQVGSPAKYHLAQMDRVLPEIALKLRALVVTIRGQDEGEGV